MIEECVNVIESDPEIGMVYTNTVKVVNGKEVARRVKNYLPTRILPDLLVNTKRFWSTPSCLWKYDVSLVENWLVLRNHEDYLHDIYCSKITNKIRYVSTALTFNNHSAENRIIRDREEVKKALIKLTEISSLPSYTGISHFILLRMYQYKMYLKPIYIYRIVKLFYKEFGFTSLRYFEVIGVLFLLNYSSIRSYRLKSYMNLK